MKSLFLAIALTSVTAHAAAPAQSPELFQCDVKAKDTKSLETKKLDPTKPPKITFKEFASQDLMPAILLQGFKRNGPNIVNYSSSGVLSAVINVEFQMNFDKVVTYPLPDNSFVKQVNIADKNTSIKFSINSFDRTKASAELLNVESSNQNIIKEIISRLGANAVKPSQFPEIGVTIKLDQKDTKKPLHLSVESTKNTTVLSVDLTEINGTVTPITIDGLSAFVYNLKAPAGFSANLNAPDSKQPVNDSELSVAGVFILGAKDATDATKAKLKELDNKKVCSAYFIHFETDPTNVNAQPK